MKTTLRLLLSFSLLASAGLVRAEEPAAPKKKWTNATEFAAVAANGNTKSSTFSGKNNFHYDWSRTGLDLYGAGLGTKSGDDVTAEQYSAGEKVSQKITDRNYIFESFEWDTNRFAGYRHRYNASAGS
jgi:putative salt-induced outer membrane protein